MIGLLCVAAVGWLVGLVMGLIASAVTVRRAEDDRRDLLRATDRVSRWFSNAAVALPADEASTVDAQLTAAVHEMEDVSFRIRDRLGLPEVDLD